MSQVPGARDMGNHDRSTGPLSGVRVVDLTHMLAGPYCTWLMGALGADIIKIEMPGRGDFTRGIGPFLGDASIYFLSVNRNKRSLTLNLKHAEGRAALKRLVLGADIFVENNRPGVMERLGLDYSAISAVNPRIVYASVSGFGQTGPYSHRPAFDAVIQAMGGTMSITGEEAGPAIRVGASIGDIGASMFAAVGILAALHERDRLGRGSRVDVAMLDAQIAMLENALARYLNTGEVPKRLGTRHPLIAPFQAFLTADNPIIVCVDTESQWQQLCAAIEKPALATDTRFAEAGSRLRHHTELEAILTAVFETRTAAHWLRVLDAAGVPSGPINTIPEVAADPHVRARDMIVEVGEGRFAAQPIRLGHPLACERPAPTLGQHTAEILAELGYDPDAIEHLRNAGAI
jgi:crotonobetainyl-CoA:carnitine CoA-transferase CaiB-like acyl-CoA transferase